MKQIGRLTILAIVVTFVVSCAPKETNDIYLCGTGADVVGFYIKNGESHRLEFDENTRSEKVYVKDILVYNNDVYCCGYAWLNYFNDDGVKEGSGYGAFLWKNGKPVMSINRVPEIVGHVSTEFHEMEIRDGVIYIVGSIAVGKQINRMTENRWPCATIWSYNTANNHISQNTFDYDAYCATGIYIDKDGMIHMVGTGGKHWSVSSDGNWSVNTYKADRFDAIFGNNDQMYMCGYSDGNAMYYSDGWERVLPSGDKISIVTGKIVGNDVYMCGYWSSEYHARCYKNGQPVEFLSNKERSVDSAIFAMDSKDEDVYMVGYLNNQAGYWKNMKFCPVGIQGGKITGIVVL